MQALSEGAVQVKNISEAADTVTLNNILEAGKQSIVDINYSVFSTAFSDTDDFLLCLLFQISPLCLVGTSSPKSFPHGFISGSRSKIIFNIAKKGMDKNMLRLVSDSPEPLPDE